MAKKKKTSGATDPKSVNAIVKAIKTPLNFFVLIILIIEGVLGTVTGFSQGQDRTILIIGMISLIFVTIAVVALMAFFKPEALKGKERKITGIVTTLPDRESYLTAMIEQCDTAKTSIWLSVHTMKPSKANTQIGELQDRLSTAKVEGKDVRILMPCGYEKIEAAHELNEQKKIPIKALSYLNIEDLRYMVIDNNISIISLGKSDAQGSSTAGAVINSEQLNQLLRKHFLQHWNNENALDYDAFLASEVRGLLNPSHPNSRESIAARLGIPKPEVDRVLSMPVAKVIFLFGRPCSGKTSAADIMKNYLDSVGYSSSQVKVYNDYRTLFTWFKQGQYKECFESGPRGGFRVTNFDVLDNCLRELNEAVSKDISNKQFIIVEFSRNEYIHALKTFAPQIQESCAILYLQASLNTCIKRNEGRAVQGSTDDTGFIPLDILETYYAKDDIEELGKRFAERLIKIENTGNSLEPLKEKINDELSKRLVPWLLERKL